MGMLEEILASGEAWREALDLADRVGLPKGPTLFLGSGSSYFLAQVAAHLARQRGKDALALPSGEAMLFPEGLRGWEQVVGISRSGETTELLQAVRALGLPAWLLTTRDSGPGHHLFAQVVVLSRAEEEAIVQTRSFSSALVYVLRALTGEEGLRGLPGRLAGVLEAPGDFPRGEAYFFLGVGAAWGVAQEAALKLKETALVWAEAFQSLEFRHGPKSLVSEGTVVFLLKSHPMEEPLLEELSGLGARVVVLPGGVLDLPLSLVRIQLFAHRLARERGLDPDRPRHLTYAVRL
ncbi:SIS domain-containing protein [Thermus sp.]|jgi:fructoselysine-6-P-deglycase FrlB-like protein|uniref:SIS domain-containing protein n=1 Tax=Thermus sp. TaxID=275 RepID=UPI0032200D57